MRIKIEEFRWYQIQIVQIAGDYPALSKLSVFMRPQRIVSYLSLNVIMHLEVKLNCNQILKNTYHPKVSIYILAVLCYKNEQTNILLIPLQYEEFYYKTSYRNNNAGLDASYVKSDNIKFPSTYKNISSVEQQYFSISGNADTVWLSSIV